MISMQTLAKWVCPNCLQNFISCLSFSGYSWLAGQVDLTGPGSSVVFLGANLGWLVIIIRPGVDKVKPKEWIKCP